MRENVFQAQLISEIRRLFPKAVILKVDPNYLQGIPDRFILFGKHWAALETKAGINSHRQPNQQYYIELLNSMSFARFIHPDNAKEVLNELQLEFRK